MGAIPRSRPHAVLACPQAQGWKTPSCHRWRSPQSMPRAMQRMPHSNKVSKQANGTTPSSPQNARTKVDAAGGAARAHGLAVVAERAHQLLYRLAVQLVLLLPVLYFHSGRSRLNMRGKGSTQQHISFKRHQLRSLSKRCSCLHGVCHNNRRCLLSRKQLAEHN